MTTTSTATASPGASATALPTSASETSTPTTPSTPTPTATAAPAASPSPTATSAAGPERLRVEGTDGPQEAGNLDVTVRWVEKYGPPYPDGRPNVRIDIEIRNARGTTSELVAVRHFRLREAAAEWGAVNAMDAVALTTSNCNPIDCINPIPWEVLLPPGESISGFVYFIFSTHSRTPTLLHYDSAGRSNLTAEPLNRINLPPLPRFHALIGEQVRISNDAALSFGPMERHSSTVPELNARMEITVTNVGATPWANTFHPHNFSFKTTEDPNHRWHQMYESQVVRLADLCPASECPGAFPQLTADRLTLDPGQTVSGYVYFNLPESIDIATIDRLAWGRTATMFRE